MKKKLSKLKQYKKGEKRREKQEEETWKLKE